MPLKFCLNSVIISLFSLSAISTAWKHGLFQSQINFQLHTRRQHPKHWESTFFIFLFVYRSTVKSDQTLVPPGEQKKKDRQRRNITGERRRGRRENIWLNFLFIFASEISRAVFLCYSIKVFWIKVRNDP